MYLKHDKIRLHRCENQTIIKWREKMLTVYGVKRIRRIVIQAHIYINYECILVINIH